jgi:hypothetical protein
MVGQVVQLAFDPCERGLHRQPAQQSRSGGIEHAHPVELEHVAKLATVTAQDAEHRTIGVDRRRVPAERPGGLGRQLHPMSTAGSRQHHARLCQGS